MLKIEDKKGLLKFLGIFIGVILLFAGIRHLFDIPVPSYDHLKSENLLPTEEDKNSADNDNATSPSEENPEENSEDVSASNPDISNKDTIEPEITILDSVNKKTKLYSLSGKIWNYDECFADTQYQHNYAARKFGIEPVEKRSDVLALANQYKVVSIDNSPFFVVDDLKYSMPYLIPSAKELLTRISINFIDSLQSKGHKLYLPIVSSVLRTTSDVEKLRRRNRNATDDSCHSYGTTFDITYSRFMPLTGLQTPVDSAEWRDSELKLTLAEVIYDLRDQGKCFVKHEKKQPCFHITVRY